MPGPFNRSSPVSPSATTAPALSWGGGRSGADEADEVDEANEADEVDEVDEEKEVDEVDRALGVASPTHLRRPPAHSRSAVGSRRGPLGALREAGC